MYPLGIRYVIVGQRFAGCPYGGEIDQRVVELYASFLILAHGVDNIDQADQLGIDTVRTDSIVLAS